MTPKLTLAALLPALSIACATALTPGGAAVKVYETDRPGGEPESKLPAGCRMLSATAPFRQQEQERVNVRDPYRAERNATADRGGNVLLVRSKTLIELKKTDCATTDRSPECQERNQSWYDVTLESYACDGQAVAALAATPAPQRRAFWWPFDPKKPAPAAAVSSAAAPAAAPAAASRPEKPSGPAPAPTTFGLSTSELKAQILALMQEGVGTDVLVAYVKSRRVSAALSAEEIVDWKRSGIEEAVIEAAIAQSSVH